MARSRHTAPKNAPARAAPDAGFRVQAKAQVTIDPRARTELNIRPGDRVFWIRNEQGRWELWTLELLDRAFEDALEGLDVFLRKSRRGFAKRQRRLRGGS